MDLGSGIMKVYHLMHRFCFLIVFKMANKCKTKVKKNQSVKIMKCKVGSFFGSKIKFLETCRFLFEVPSLVWIDDWLFIFSFCYSLNRIEQWLFGKGLLFAGYLLRSLGSEAEFSCLENKSCCGLCY